MVRTRYKLSDAAHLALRMRVFSGVVLLMAVIMASLPAGYVGPFSARVRGLFIKHTRTGNPLVDSVAEHQATPPSVYWQYYHFLCLLGPIGTVGMAIDSPSSAGLFIIAYALIGAYFSGKMIRLVLLLSPAACVASGACIALAIRLTIDAYNTPIDEHGNRIPQAGTANTPQGRSADGRHGSGRGGDGRGRGRGERGRGPRGRNEGDAPPTMTDELSELQEIWDENVETRRTCGLVFLSVMGMVALVRFLPHSFRLGEALSEPQIMMRGRSKDKESGKEYFIIDDFREAYWWLRDNTPQDARVMAWWDYGYQINGLSHRTTLADGNTWNHEHIALLGKCLTAPENVSHAITRHLADYVLIWTTRYAGMYSDDVAKSPHMARIGASVYGDRIGCDASEFFMTREGVPSDCMRESLLWRLHSVRIAHAPSLFSVVAAFCTPTRSSGRLAAAQLAGLQRRAAVAARSP